MRLYRSPYGPQLGGANRLARAIGGLVQGQNTHRLEVERKRFAYLS